MLVVAVARIGLDTSDCASLKDKRRISKGIIDRVKHRFNVSISEIEENDFHSVLVLGISTTSNTTNHAASRIDKLLSFIENLYLAPVIFREREIINFGALEQPFWELESDTDWDQVKQSISSFEE
ncbi:MAG: DUF503 domain-containing protein [Deltaproteobacteria bacterium]|nr:DUF503 domain-containing protein [Deltaproteobacteria bacterium]